MGRETDAIKINRGTRFGKISGLTVPIDRGNQFYNALFEPN